LSPFDFTIAFGIMLDHTDTDKVKANRSPQNCKVNAPVTYQGDLAPLLETFEDTMPAFIE